MPRENKKKRKPRKAAEKDRSERQTLLKKKEQLSTRPAPEPHPGGGKKSSYPRSPNEESSFHSALNCPIHTSPSPLIDSKSPALRKQGEACVGTLGFILLHLLVPKLIQNCGVLVELCSAGDLFMIEPIKVDLEALAQAKKVGEALGSMQGSEPAERAAQEIEQLVSCPHKMALFAAVFLLAAAALAYNRYS